MVTRTARCPTPACFYFWNNDVIIDLLALEASSEQPADDETVASRPGWTLCSPTFLSGFPPDNVTFLRCCAGSTSVEAAAEQRALYSVREETGFRRFEREEKNGKTQNSGPVFTLSS